ncbi:hypothetical protein D3C87_1775510 [compost metagenome]
MPMDFPLSAIVKVPAMGSLKTIALTFALILMVQLSFLFNTVILLHVPPTCSKYVGIFIVRPVVGLSPIFRIRNVCD